MESQGAWLNTMATVTGSGRRAPAPTILAFASFQLKTVADASVVALTGSASFLPARPTARTRRGSARQRPPGGNRT
jgi:hypothetical protein